MGIRRSRREFLYIHVAGARTDNLVMFVWAAKGILALPGMNPLGDSRRRSNSNWARRERAPRAPTRVQSGLVRVLLKKQSRRPTRPEFRDGIGDAVGRVFLGKILVD